MRNFRTLDEIEEDYFRQHPDEIDEYIEIIFDEFSQDQNMGALLASLRSITRVKGVAATAEAAGMTRKGLQKALSESGNPNFRNMNAILKALGYKLTPEKYKL